MTPSTLTKEQFQKWRLKHNMSKPACAIALGISQSSVNLYETGVRQGRIVQIPLTVCLAMSAVDNDLKPYAGEDDDRDKDNSGS